MRVFLDDERPVPDGWVGARWPSEVVALLEAGGVTEISLDHDLGDDARGTGYDVILWIEEAVATRGFVPPQIIVHSANASARVKMEAGVRAIERLVRRRSEARFTELATLPHGWDADGLAPPPNTIAIANAKVMLEALTHEGAKVGDIDADAIGGVALYFFFDSRTLWIACYNHGTIVAVGRDAVEGNAVAICANQCNAGRLAAWLTGAQWPSTQGAKMSTRRTCTSRIQGNGDSDECGRPVQQGDTCELCLPREIETARRNAVVAEQAAAEARARLVALVGTAEAVSVMECGAADAIGGRDGHVQPTERTPEVVLRAMLRAYQDDRLDIEIAYHELSEGRPLRRRIPIEQRDADITSLRMLIGNLIAAGIDCATLREFFQSGTRTALGLDFHARLRGERPLDAPPLCRDLF